MKNLFKTIAKYKWKVAVLVAVLMVQAYCDLALPEYVRKIIDNGILGGGSVKTASGSDIDMDYLLICGRDMLTVTVVMFIASGIVAFFASRIGAKIGRNLRSEIYSKVMSFSEAELNGFSTASLITRSTNDVQQIQLVITMMLRMLFYAPVIGIYGVIKISTGGTGMQWIIALAVLVTAGLVILLMSITIPKFKMMQVLIDGLNKVSREILTGLPVVRAFGTEKFEEQRFDEASRKLMENQLFTSKVMSLMQPTMTLFMNFVVAVITWVAAHRIDMGEMQVGQMTEFITYSITIVMSFLFMSMMSIMLPRAGVACDRVYEVLSKEPSIRDSEDAVSVSKAGEGSGAEVRFENVSFRYPNADEDAVSGIDFTAKAGETTAIIGSTGCGKTTLINLIPRFHDVTEGKVTIEGTDIRDMKLKDLRKLIGIIPQKGLLFSGTIESNVKFGSEDKTHEDVVRACDIAQASEFISKMEDGYRSRISQGGSNVSGGQKQRLAIARAVIKDPDILIFDDSFSALDMKTDAALRKRLKEELSGVTKIVVAQRISTVLTADQIIVMDEGVISGKGTHQELMDSCKVYREIAESQLSKAELGR